MAKQQCDECWSQANIIAAISSTDLDTIYDRLLSECEHDG